LFVFWAFECRQRIRERPQLVFEPVASRDERALRVLCAFCERGGIEKAQQRGVQLGARVSIAAFGQEEAWGDGRAVDTRRKSILLVVDERQPLRIFVEHVSIHLLE